MSLILVVDDDQDLRKLVVHLLTGADHDCIEAADGAEAVIRAQQSRPDLIVMDMMMPRVSGADALEQLRADRRTAFTPVIFLTAKSLVSDVVDALVSGADDYLAKPFDPDELLARVNVAIRRSRLLRDLNPISGLPGNAVISAELQGRLEKAIPFACLYVDLNQFKGYNDHYGFAQGDVVIAALARIIYEALEGNPSGNQFAGHVGGDDFVVLESTETWESVAKDIVERFDAAVKDFYPSDDYGRGYIEVENRRGEKERVPLVSVSIGVVLSTQRQFETPAEVAEAAAQMKKAAKAKPGSSWAVDRRGLPQD